MSNIFSMLMSHWRDFGHFKRSDLQRSCFWFWFLWWIHYVGQTDLKVTQSYLSLPRAGVTGMSQHTCLGLIYNKWCSSISFPKTGSLALEKVRERRGQRNWAPQIQSMTVSAWGEWLKAVLARASHTLPCLVTGHCPDLFMISTLPHSWNSVRT